MSWNEENNALVKEFELGSFKDAVEFVNKIQPLADEMNHHPDILIHSYKKVKVTLTTHKSGEVTQLDHALADKIDAIDI